MSDGSIRLHYFQFKSLSNGEAEVEVMEIKGQPVYAFRKRCRRLNLLYRHWPS